MSFLESHYAREAYFAKLRELKRTHDSASKLGKSSCQRCGICCWVRPPRLSRADLARLASELAISEGDFFDRYCVVDDPANTFGPVLRRTSQEQWASELLSDAETFNIGGPCVFLERSEETGLASCAVDGVKPDECREQACWVRSSGTLAMPSWPLSELRELGYCGGEP